MDKTWRQDCNPLMKVGQVYITKSMEGAPFKIGKYSMHTSFDHLQTQNSPYYIKTDLFAARQKIQITC